MQKFCNMQDHDAISTALLTAGTAAAGWFALPACQQVAAVVLLEQNYS